MIRLVIVLLLATAWLDGHTQSSLLPCPEDASSNRTNCFGTLTFPSGEQYVGEFRDGKFNGEGTYTYSDGQKYVGSFRNNNFFGQGTLISPKGYTIVEGIWRDLTVSKAGTQWTLVTSTLDGSDTYFVLPQSIRKDGALRRAWLLVAYGSPQPRNNGLSRKALYQFDCLNERSLLKTSTTYGGVFGDGEVLDSLDEGRWTYVTPDSVFSFVSKYVCGYKLADK
jgi:hypothetical protein